MSGRSPWRRRVRLALVVLLAALAGGEAALRLTPFPSALLTPPAVSAEFVDRNGRPLRTLLVNDRRYARNATLSEVSPHVIAATLSAEDRRFYAHPGVDPIAIARAGWDSLMRRQAVSGASTITQQLVKISHPSRRTISQKIVEAWLALRVERSWSKERILTEYLNRLDYGELQSGIAAASLHFFGKPALDLSASEAALLAALPRAPTRLNPRAHPEQAENRRRWVLGRMLATHRLDAAGRERALTEPIVLAAPGRAYAAPQFVDLLLSRQSVVPQRGGPVRTTLDLELNRVAERALASNLQALAEKHASAGAAVVIHNATGDVLALACKSSDPASAAAHINSAWMVRSPGSAMKPFTYLLALEHGAFPGTVVADVSTDFSTDSGSYRPNNYNHRFYGPVSLRFALGNSLNVAAVRVLEMAGGPEALQQTMRVCGITTLHHDSEYYGLGLTLGNGEVRLLELANAYATLARLGEYRPFRLLQREGSASTSSRRVFAADGAYLLADMLSDNGARAASFGLDSFLSFEFPVAVKTGTSSDYRDNWCAGYTPEFTVVVWVGNADGRPMHGITGVTGAAPVLHELFEHLHATRGTSWYPAPENIRAYEIEPLTGHVVAQGSRGALLEKAIRPPPAATAEDYDEGGRVLLSPVYGEWLASAQNTLGSVATVRVAARAAAAGAMPDFQIISPSIGSVFILDPDLPLKSQCISLQATSARPLQWSSETLSVHTDHASPRAQLAEGRHHLTARDASTGATVETWIEVRSL